MLTKSPSLALRHTRSLARSPPHSPPRSLACSPPPPSSSSSSSRSIGASLEAPLAGPEGDRLLQLRLLVGQRRRRWRGVRTRGLGRRHVQAHSSRLGMTQPTCAGHRLPRFTSVVRAASPPWRSRRRTSDSTTGPSSPPRPTRRGRRRSRPSRRRRRARHAGGDAVARRLSRPPPDALFAAMDVDARSRPRTCARAHVDLGDGRGW